MQTLRTIWNSQQSKGKYICNAKCNVEFSPMTGSSKCPVSWEYINLVVSNYRLGTSLPENFMRRLLKMGLMLKCRQSALGTNTVALDLFAFLTFTTERSPSHLEVVLGKMLMRLNLCLRCITNWSLDIQSLSQVPG